MRCSPLARALVLCLALAACGGGAAKPAAQPAATQAATQSRQPAAAAAPATQPAGQQTAAATTGGLNPCTLSTRADVEAELGGKLRDEPFLSQGSGGSVTCLLDVNAGTGVMFKIVQSGTKLANGEVVDAAKV